MGDKEIMTIALALLGLLAADPAPPPAAAAVTDDEVWALARKVDTLGAYRTYMVRFLRGAHTRQAIDAFERLSRPAINMHPVALAPVPKPKPPPDPKLAACAALLTDQSLHRVDSDEARAYLAARLDNRPVDFRAYLEHFPNGTCSTAATEALNVCAAHRFESIPGLGPLGPHRFLQTFIAAADYPPAALRAGEQGRVAAAWEVAEDGIPESCRIVQSSGSAALDEATCRIVVTRLVYDPARDASGTPVRSSDRMTVTWVLPPVAPPRRPL
jgi:TonB family protein